MQNTTRILAVLLLTVIGTSTSIALAQSTDPLSLIFTPPAATTTTEASATTSTTNTQSNTTTTTGSAVSSATPAAAIADLPTVENVIAKASGTSINLIWDAVNGADNYTIYYGDTSTKNGGTYAATVVAGNVTTFEIKDLTPGTTYYLAVTAENTKEKIGSKFYSTESVVTLDAASPAPTEPEQTPATPITSTETEETALPEGMHGSAPKMKKLPQSGPEVALIALLASAGAYLTRKWGK